MKDTEKFEVHTFDQLDDSHTDIVESDLEFSKAEALANELWISDKCFGVEIISSDVDNMEPIVWIKSKHSETDGKLSLSK